MAGLYGFDAFSPAEVAEKVESIGVAKARLPLMQMLALSVLGGAFLGLGALYSVLVQSDATLGFALSRILGGVAFSLAMLLVVVAGAELFTGNNLLAMAWATGRLSTREVIANWTLVLLANLAGAAGLAVLVFLSGHWQMNEGAIGETYLRIAAAKSAGDPMAAFFRGVLCNVLACMAFWMAMAGHTVVDRLAAIILPISALAAAGFEHCIANMYYFSMAVLLHLGGHASPALAGPLDLNGMAINLAAVTAGNLVGGSVLVAMVFWLIYVRGIHLPAAETGSEAKRE